MKAALWILWPSFVVGGIATALFFSVLDPVDFIFVGPLELSRSAGYSIGFFLFWGVAAASSAFTSFLKK